jgi:hypothetical protein
VLSAGSVCCLGGCCLLLGAAAAVCTCCQLVFAAASSFCGAVQHVLVCLGAGFDAALCVGGHCSCPAAFSDSFWVFVYLRISHLL